MIHVPHLAARKSNTAQSLGLVGEIGLDAVDLLKLESPCSRARFTIVTAAPPPRRRKASSTRSSRSAAMPAYPGCFCPGASTQDFERVLDYAYAAGAGGFLAGRTIWLKAVRSHFLDAEAVGVALAGRPRRIKQPEPLTKMKASPWRPRYSGLDAVVAKGDFARDFSFASS